MDKYYVGSEIKFAINLEQVGFDMDNDDFDIEVRHPRGSVKASKGEQTGPLVIFKEADSSSSDSTSSDSSDSSSVEEGGWYAIVNTTGFAAGELKVIATAYVVDANADEGVRQEIDVKSLCTLSKTQ